MNKIVTKKFLLLWDEILRLEHKTDAELAGNIGIRPSTVSNWRTGRSKAVRPHQIAAIEKKLGYSIELTRDGKWKIAKRSASPTAGVVSDSSPLYFSMPGHITENERDRYEKLIKRLKDIPPGDIERIIGLIDLLFKKK
ncbi:MAG TPA: helix-turn-helix transcriptional regulator [Bacteroidota bacterium]